MTQLDPNELSREYNALPDYKARERFIADGFPDKLSTHTLHVLGYAEVFTVRELNRALDDGRISRKTNGVGQKTWWELVGAAGRDPAAFPYKKANICPHCGKPIARSK